MTSQMVENFGAREDRFSVLRDRIMNRSTSCLSVGEISGPEDETTCGPNLVISEGRNPGHR